MTQWKPTYGLRNAVPTVVALENALIGMGHEMGPVLRYRMTEIVREALDRAVGAPDEPELPIRDTVSEGDVPDFGYPNGSHTVTGHYDEASGRVSFSHAPEAVVQRGGMSLATPQEIVANIKGAAQKAQKRGRGRPKGAKGRKAKAGKTGAPEATGEAPA